MKSSSIPGFHDRLPNVARKKYDVIRLCEDVSRKYCFNIIETPHIELAEVLSKGGDEIQKEVYLFKDKGGREIGLRFDLTVPLSRFIKEHFDKIEIPFKRFAFGSVFRGEKPQKGRFREFTQIDFDVVGSSSMECEIEVIDVITNVLNELGIDYTVKLNDKALALALAEWAKAKDTTGFLRLLDKASKMTDSEFASEAQRFVPPDKVDQLVYIKNRPYESCYLISQAIGCGLSHRRVFEDLQTFQSLVPNSEIDPFIVRGLDYYTGRIFEIFSKSLDVGAVASGGRYDNLIKSPRNEPLPAFGGSIGIDRILSVLQEPSVKYDVFIVRLKDNTYQELKQIQLEILGQGLSCEIYFEGIDTKKQLKYAEKKGFRFIIFVRPGEISLIDKATGIESKFATYHSAIEYLKKKID